MNVLVIGETGSGKSTFINTLTNYFRGGSLDNLCVAIPTQFLRSTEEFRHDENDLGNVTSSKTDSCNIYRFKKKATLTEFVFIDTPGLSDTRGVKQDDANLEKIMTVSEELGSVAAIVVIINGTTSRLTVNLKNVITRLKGSLPDAVLDNIIVVLTNCWKHDSNFDIGSLGLKPKKVYYMNNTAFSTNPKKWDKSAKRRLNADWQDCMDQLQKLCQTIKELSPTSTEAFKQMREQRNHIKSTLHNARLQIVQLQKLQDDLDAAQTALGKYGADAEAFKNYVQKKVVTQNELVDAPYHSTICSSCNFVCHDHCGLNEISNTGDNQFTGCAAMGGSSNCRMCEGRCSYTRHYHGRKTMRQVSKTLETVLADVKAKYDTATQAQQQASQKINSVTSAKQAVDRAISSMNTELVKCCRELKKLCSGFNLVDELHIVLQQLEAEARALNSTDARRTADTFIRSIRQLCDNLSQTDVFQQQKKAAKLPSACTVYLKLPLCESFTLLQPCAH